MERAIREAALIWAPLSGNTIYMVRLGYKTAHGGGSGWNVWSRN
jgi:hypothetical protein